MHADVADELNKPKEKCLLAAVCRILAKYTAYILGLPGTSQVVKGSLIN